MRKTLAILLCASAAYCTVPGIDLTGLESNVNWNAARAGGKQFAYILATRSTTYRNPFFNQQFGGATAVRLFRGAYHLAEPNSSNGENQANFFLAQTGGWRPGNGVLPGAVSLERAPSGNICWGISTDAMVTWIRDFSNTYKTRTGRYPVVFTTTAWWNQCTGRSTAFGATNPLWLENHGSVVGPLPAGWKSVSFWQTTDNAGNGLGAGDIWTGDMASLAKFAVTA